MRPDLLRPEELVEANCEIPLRIKNSYWEYISVFIKSNYFLIVTSQWHTVEKRKKACKYPHSVCITISDKETVQRCTIGQMILPNI